MHASKPAGCVLQLIGGPLVLWGFVSILIALGHSGEGGYASGVWSLLIGLTLMLVGRTTR